MRTVTLVLLAAAPLAVSAQERLHLMDTHTFVQLMIDELELGDALDANDVTWDANLSVGGDLHKFWFKTEGERSDTDGDRTELQFLYSKAILPFWNLRAGMRRDIELTPDRDWAAVSLKGLAPKFYDVEAEFFFAEGGQTSVRVRGEYELLLTQRLILAPELEILTYGRSEPSQQIGAGLSEIGLDLRLRYEIKREIAPYIGLSWHRLYGTTRSLTTSAGRDDEDTQLVIGLRTWF